MPGFELVSGLVALDALGMEQLSHHRFKAQLALQTVKQIRLGGLLIEFNTGTGGQMLGQRFAKLA
jgi:hypothetical protein